MYRVGMRGTTVAPRWPDGCLHPPDVRLLLPLDWLNDYYATNFMCPRRNAWHHGGPTAAFIHLVSAFCFLLPRIIIEAKLIQVGFLSRGGHVVIKNTYKFWISEVGTPLEKMLRNKYKTRGGNTVKEMLRNKYKTRGGHTVKEMLSNKY